MHVGIEIAAECSSEVFTEGKSPRSPLPTTTLSNVTVVPSSGRKLISKRTIEMRFS